MPAAANFFYYPLNPTVDDTVQFIDLTADGATRGWRFGDGSTAADPWPEHRFERDGSYDVELSVCTEAGDVVSVTRALRVAPRLEPG